MTNYEYIKNMNQQDLADYIQSVFIAGRLYERTIKTSFNIQNSETMQMIDYNEWLVSEHVLE